MTKIVTVFVFGFSVLYAQLGLTLPGDTLKYSLYNFNSLHLKAQSMLTIEYLTPEPFIIDPQKYTPSSNPFVFDNRSNSYYVPRQIRDELNLIMNRPKTADSMVPIIAIPLIAAQIAANYIWVQEKSKIRSKNILNAAEEMDLLRLLWQDSPLTISMISNNMESQNAEKYEYLEKRMQVLSDNKLVKIKKVENGESRYYPAKTKQELAEIIRAIINEGNISEEEHEVLLSIIYHLE
jgi:hypothetical protein